MKFALRLFITLLTVVAAASASVVHDIIYKHHAHMLNGRARYGDFLRHAPSRIPCLRVGRHFTVLELGVDAPDYSLLGEPPAEFEYRHDCMHDEHMHRSGFVQSYSLEHRALIYETLSKNETYRETKEKEILKRQTTGRAPMRIFFDASLVGVGTDTYACNIEGQTVTLDDGTSHRCEAADIMTSSKVNIIRNFILPALQELIATTLSVDRIQGNLVLSEDFYANYWAAGLSCRSNVPIPNNLLTVGQPDTDYYMFIIARPIPSKNAVANANPCGHDVYVGGHLSRPLAGSINFNSGADILNKMDPTNVFQFAYMISVGFHEVTHAFGFTSYLYADYRTPLNGFYGGPWGPAKLFTRENQPWSLYHMTSPRVLAYAREHFACDKLEGVEIEEADPQPSKGYGPGSHWDKRIVGDEFMSPVASAELIVSKLTLSLYEDMGWYSANYSVTSPSYYGSQAGCTLVQERCSSSAWGGYFCDTSCISKGCDRCNGDRTAVGACTVSRYPESLPVYYRNFDDPTVGGGAFVDYCPVIVGYDNRFCHDINAVNNAAPGLGESYGFTSNCFDITVDGAGSSGCYPKRCVNSSGNPVLFVTVNSVELECPRAGGPVTTATPAGVVSVECPPVGFFCSRHLTDPTYTVPFTFDENTNVPSTTPRECAVSDWTEWTKCDGSSQQRTRVVLYSAVAACPALEETKSCAGTNGGIIVPIVLAVIVVLILIIIAAVFITKYVRRKKVRKSSAGSKNAAAETQTASVPMEPLQVPQPQLHPVPTTNTPPPPVPTRPIQAHVRFSHTARNTNELTVEAGQVVNVLSREGEWWLAEANEQQGYLPSNYLQLL